MNTAKIVSIEHARRSTTMGQTARGRFFSLPNWIADIHLPPVEKSLLLMVARATIGWHKQQASISTADLMQALMVSKNTILKTRAALIEKGLISVQETSGGRGASTIYQLNHHTDPLEITPFGGSKRYASAGENGSNSEPFQPVKGSPDDPLNVFKNAETVHQMNTTGSNSEPFQPVKGSPDEHTILNTDIKYRDEITDMCAQQPEPHEPEKSGNAIALDQEQPSPDHPDQPKGRHKREAAQQTSDPYPAAAGVNPQAWAEFQQHRKTIRKPVTELAARKLQNLLLQYDTNTQQAMVDQSIASRWTGIFPLKGSKPNTASTNQSRNQSLRPTVEDI
ncbi:MAG: replication protein [Thiothrix sp.]|nr:replication protein [Thiothrix sp.]HPQ96779.1 replication protein [Thiolinea sp.]